MKHKSRFLLPILTLLTFGIVAGSVAVNNVVNADSTLKKADAGWSDPGPWKMWLLHHDNSVSYISNNGSDDNQAFFTGKHLLKGEKIRFYKENTDPLWSYGWDKRRTDCAAITNNFKSATIDGSSYLECTTSGDYNLYFNVNNRDNLAENSAPIWINYESSYNLDSYPSESGFYLVGNDVFTGTSDTAWKYTGSSDKLTSPSTSGNRAHITDYVLDVNVEVRGRGLIDANDVWTEGTSLDPNTNSFATNNGNNIKILKKSSFNFYWNSSNQLCVACAVYTITLDDNGGGGGSSSVGSVIYGNNPSNVTVPTKTGYNFQGYYDGIGGTGTQYYNASGVSSKTWDKNENATLYAKWTAKTPTVTLNKNATDAVAGTTSVTATYNAAMPTAGVTMPTRTGYAFMGYYDTSASTGGTQYYTATGASARTWDKENNTILYARWEYCFDFNVPLTGGVGLTFTFNSTFATQHPNINKVVINYPNPDKIEGDEDRTLTKEFTTFGAIYVGVNAVQLTEDITFEIYESDVKTVEGSVTVADVIKSKHDAGNQSVKNLCGALLAYGTYAQTAFSYNTENSAIDVLNNTELENTYLSFIASADLTDDGKVLGTHTGVFSDQLKFVISAGMNTTTIFRFYFECSDSEAETLSATLTDTSGNAFSNGMEISDVKSEAIMVSGVRKVMHYYEVSGIKPTNIKTLFRINITGDAGNCTITYSVGTYLKVLNDTSGVGAVYKNLAKATERYYYYASAYAA